MQYLSQSFRVKDQTIKDLFLDIGSEELSHMEMVADPLSNIASEQRAKVVYEYLYRQINDKFVRETIDFLLNREEAHNALFREALNKVKDTGSNKDFGITEDSRLYFDLSTPGKYFDAPNPTAPSFENPRK